MSKLILFLFRWGPAILMMGIIFTFSSIPSKAMPDFGLVDYLIKKGGHAIGYGLLALTYLRGLKGGRRGLIARHLYMAWIIAVLYSVTDEFHQSFVPGRFPSITDVMIDSVGAIIALYAASRHYNKNDQLSTGH